MYREWAPAAAGAALIGDFNGWNGESHKMARLMTRTSLWKTRGPDETAARILDRLCLLCCDSPCSALLGPSCSGPCPPTRLSAFSSNMFTSTETPLPLIPFPLCVAHSLLSFPTWLPPPPSSRPAISSASGASWFPTSTAAPRSRTSPA